MKKNLLLALFLLAYEITFAQDYVVTIKGDTLWGKVKYISNIGGNYSVTNSKYVQLTPQEGKKSTHKVPETISFRIDNTIYHTIKLDPGYTFMKVIKSGYLSLYSYQLEKQTTWDGRYFVKKDGTLLDVPNLGFKKRVSKFLEDCPEVVNDIQSGALNRSNLTELVEKYNACVDAKTNLVTLKTPVAKTWTTLLTEVEALPEFGKKTDVIEMIREIQSRLSKKEQVPSFLTNALKDALNEQSSVKETLDKALESLN